MPDVTRGWRRLQQRWWSAAANTNDSLQASGWGRPGTDFWAFDSMRGPAYPALAPPEAVALRRSLAQVVASAAQISASSRSAKVVLCRPVSGPPPGMASPCSS